MQTSESICQKTSYFLHVDT